MHCTYGSVYEAWQRKRLKLLGVGVDEDDGVSAAVVLYQCVPGGLDGRFCLATLHLGCTPYMLNL